MNEFLEKLKNSIIGASVADAPAITTASGWLLNKDGKWILGKSNKELADNLATISTMSPTHPITATLGYVFPGSINVFAKRYFKHKYPGYEKIYHGTHSSLNDLRKGRPYSGQNVGLHVSPIRKMAESFSKGKGKVLEGYVPQPNMTTIDLNRNNWRWVSNSVEIPALPASKSPFYANAGDNSFMINLLQKHGAKPTVKTLSRIKNVTGLHTENTVKIPLRNETWKEVSKVSEKQADDIVKYGTVNDGVEANKRAALLLSNNGIKVIKYNNVHASEGGGGTAYAITDPSVIKIPFKIGEYEKYIIGTAPTVFNRL